MYEVSGQQLSESLASANTEVFSAQTVDLILDLATNGGNSAATVNETTVSSGGQVTVPSGTDVALVTVSNSGTTTFTAPANIPVLIINSPTGSVDVTFNDVAAAARAGALSAPANAESIQRVVVGPGGSDKMVVNDNKNSYIDGGTGNDTIISGGGNDSLVGGQGNDSLAGGTGSDTIVAGVGNDTVDGGTGNDHVTIAGSLNDYVVTVENGHLKMTKSADGTVTDLQNVEYVQLNNNQAVIAVAGKAEASVAVLYETLFKRTADEGGLHFWENAVNAGVSFEQIGQDFISLNASSFSGLTDAQFIERLYANTFNRVGSQIDDAGKAFWLTALANGNSRGEIAASFANIAVDNFGNPEITTVGYVKIIDGLV